MQSLPDNDKTSRDVGFGVVFAIAAIGSFIYNIWYTTEMPDWEASIDRWNETNPHCFDGSATNASIINASTSFGSAAIAERITRFDSWINLEILGIVLLCCTVGGGWIWMMAHRIALMSRLVVGASFVAIIGVASWLCAANVYSIGAMMLIGAVLMVVASCCIDYGMAKSSAALISNASRVMLNHPSIGLSSVFFLFIKAFYIGLWIAAVVSVFRSSPMDSNCSLAINGFQITIMTAVWWWRVRATDMMRKYSIATSFKLWYCGSEEDYGGEGVFAAIRCAAHPRKVP